MEETQATTREGERFKMAKNDLRLISDAQPMIERGQEALTSTTDYPQNNIAGHEIHLHAMCVIPQTYLSMQFIGTQYQSRKKNFEFGTSKRQKIIPQWFPHSYDLWQRLEPS